MCSTPRGLPALVAAGRRQYLLPLLPPRGNIVWLVEMCQRKQTLEYMLDRVTNVMMKSNIWIDNK